MSALAGHLDDYLALRRSLGHKLDDAARLLPRFVAYLDARGAKTVSVAAALAWAQEPQAGPGSCVRAHRMTAARGFARYLAGTDPATEVPPLGLVTYRPQRHAPYLYTEADTALLMAEAGRHARSPLAAASMATLIGLLAATGMRVGEAIRLDNSDLDWANGCVVVRETKFAKSRLLPLQPSTLEALAAYQELRDSALLTPLTTSFLVAAKGKRLIYEHVLETFHQLLRDSGVGAGSPNRPRLHDFRHAFAVQALTNWARAGVDVHPRLAWLATYLGHAEPRYTYLYLSATPELLSTAAARLETAWGGRQ